MASSERDMSMNFGQMSISSGVVTSPAMNPSIPSEPASFGDEMGADIVTLVVGPTKVVYSVHRKFLCKKIKYFERMFLSGFAESFSNSATFPEDDPKSFGLLLKWAYDGRIPPVIFYKEGNIWKENWKPFKLYQLADKLDIPEVMDRTLDVFITSLKKHNLVPGLDDIEDGYSRTPPGSKLRAFLCYVFVHRLINTPTSGRFCTNEEAQKLLADQPDLAHDMVPHLREARIAPYQSLLDNLPRCQYHTHEIALVCPWESKKSNEERSI